MLVRLAWRNLWRQQRRTLLTASALALALLLSLLTRSIQEGSYASSIDHAARLSTGLIQLQHPEFADSHSIDHLLPASSEFIAFATQHPSLQYIMPRIEGFALAAAGDKSKGAVVIGVDPALEDSYSGLADKIIQGDYVQADEQQVLIAAGLANHLGVTVGEQVVLYGQGYHGQTAAGLYTIKGIVRFPMAELNNQFIFLPLRLAQQLYGCPGWVTSWLLHPADFSQLASVVAELQNHYGDGVNVRDWHSLAADMAQQILMDRAGGLVMIYLLYGIVGFALFATLVMMTLERQREFAVMLATGLLRSQLLLLIAIESAFIGVLGITLGVLVAAPILTYLHFYPLQLTGETAQLMVEMGYLPIIPVLLDPNLLLEQIWVVAMLLIVCLLYPMWRLYKLDLVAALKGGSHAG